MTSALFTFEEAREPAQSLAAELGLPCHEVEARCFPDGESLIRVPPPPETAILYRSLDHPNAKLVELLLAAGALRANGARRVVLIAPYLAYMRQDIAFRPGEAVSQKIIGGLIAERFDGLVTIDPHLHRIAHLGEAVPDIPAINLSAAPVLTAALPGDTRALLIGPDSESRPWVEAIAAPLGLEYLVGEKERLGDRQVDLVLPGVEAVAGRPAILVDDVISSGMTMIMAARLLHQAGATSVEALATHGLASTDDLARMKAAGICRIRTTQSVANETACLPVAPLLAPAIRAVGWA